MDDGEMGGWMNERMVYSPVSELGAKSDEALFVMA